MGRKKRGYQWVREDQEEEAREYVDRPIRQREKDAEKGVELLVRRLVQIDASARAALPLDDDTRAALDKLAGMSRTPARGRLARRVKQMLRYADVQAIEEALDGATPMDLHYQMLERWRGQLIAGDDADLQAFLDQFPDGDRQQLRSLVRGAKGEGKGAEKAKRALFQVMKEAAASQAP